MRIAVFGGSFDPIHREHVRYVRAAIQSLSADRVIVVPSYHAPHKGFGAVASGEDRLEMCRVALRGVPQAEVSGAELQRGGVSYTYLTCRAIAAQYPDAERFFLVGADMLEDFFTWKNPQEILSYVQLAVCGREEALPPELLRRFERTFGVSAVVVPMVGAAVSSTRVRVEIAFGKRPAELDEGVLDYIKEHKLYSHPAILPALSLEKEARREHSFRVACMACERARSLHIPEQKALLAAALHDCGKYVPLDSPLLNGFALPDGVPAPVVHEYSGAYLAETAFGVTDEEVLEAIRCHTSGKRGMSTLDKLIFLADLLEEGRSFPGVDRLRELFWRDLDVCFAESLREQIEYLERGGTPVYPPTKEAYLWQKEQLKAKNYN